MRPKKKKKGPSIRSHINLVPAQHSSPTVRYRPKFALGFDFWAAWPYCTAQKPREELFSGERRPITRARQTLRLVSPRYRGPGGVRFAALVQVFQANA